MFIIGTLVKNTRTGRLEYEENEFEKQEKIKMIPKMAAAKIAAAVAQSKNQLEI